MTDKSNATAESLFNGLLAKCPSTFSRDIDKCRCHMRRILQAQIKTAFLRGNPTAKFAVDPYALLLFVKSDGNTADAFRKAKDSALEKISYSKSPDKKRLYTVRMSAAGVMLAIMECQELGYTVAPSGDYLSIGNIIHMQGRVFDAS